MTDLTALGLDPQAMLTALYKARASGALQVTYQDAGQMREIRYRSDRELAAAIAAIEANVKGGPSVSVAYVRSTKGWL